MGDEDELAAIVAGMPEVALRGSPDVVTLAEALHRGLLPDPPRMYWRGWETWRSTLGARPLVHVPVCLRAGINQREKARSKAKYAKF